MTAATEEGARFGTALRPVGMLFVRCTGAISHHPAQYVTLEDVALAVDALEAAVLDLAELR